MEKIGTCLWFNDQAEEAAAYYAKTFKNSKKGHVSHYDEAASKQSGQKQGSVMVVDFEIEGHKIELLNGGPHFKITPALSYFYWCDSEQEVRDLWAKLSADGEVRMGLDNYPWAKLYGWTADKFGAEWQLIYNEPHKPKIAPAFLFANKLFGKGEEAIKFWMSQFPNSKIEAMAKDDKSNTIMHCNFKLAGADFVLMEGAGEHKFTFNEGVSIVVTCDTQEEIDKHWAGLTSGGGCASQCGWVKDKYGVSWQIVPKVLAELVNDPKKSGRVMAALMKMSKIDIKKLQDAAVGG